MDFLSDLAKQRGLLISATEEGKLKFYEPISDGTPVAVLSQGSSPLINVNPPIIDSQKYYSQITGIESTKTGSKGSKYTVKNSFLDKVRPLTFMVQSTTKADVKKAVDAKIGRMFANVISYEIEVSTWRDRSGKLWKPNTLIDLIAPDAMVYENYTFLIRSVKFSRSSREETAQLTLTLPGAFNGSIPTRLPWE